MGQYYKIVNVDKQEYLHPHAFNEGLKLLEFGCGDIGILTCMSLLLADGNGRGGGDLHSANPIVGSWKGNRIVVAGDYADHCQWDDRETEASTLPSGERDYGKNLYSIADEHYVDISERIMIAMFDDDYIRKDHIERLADPDSNFSPSVIRIAMEKNGRNRRDRLLRRIKADAKADAKKKSVAA